MEVNSSSTHTSDSMPNLSTIQRPGQYLSKVRIEKNIELEDAAKALVMPLKTLQALEKDDYKSLPEAAFIKGFYRSYAKYLGVDVSSIIDSFDRLYTAETGQSSVKDLTESPLQIKGKLASSRRGFSGNWVKWAGYTVALVVVIALVMMMVQKMKDASTKTETAKTTPEVQVINLDTAKPTTAKPQATTPVAQNQDRLVVEFKRPTSVHIEDAKGNVLATGRQASTLNLAGQSPFKIRIDDATVATVRLNDEEIALARYMVNGKVDFRLAR